MCGFAVALQTGETPVSPAGLLAMQQSMVHRGPDGNGIFITPALSMAHQRLSVIDLGSPPQPRLSERCVLVYNGEIYNHHELRAELAGLGVMVAHACDTDVVLSAYETWGIKAFSRFNGMFSVAIFDRATGELILARDRFGIKPLYVGEGPSGHRLIASEIQAMDAYAPGFWSTNAIAMDQYLHLGYVIEPFTLKSGVRQIKPGTVEVHTIGAPHHQVHAYWSLADAMHQSPVFLDQSEGLDLLDHAVRRQSVSDVPVGTFLSGGLDSGLLTTLLHRAKHGGDLHCFSAGFSDSGYDEVPLARALAKRLGAAHHALYFDEGLLHQSGRLAQIYGGAFADNAALPTYHLSVEAAKHVKVLLSGDGADELFFGYRNHRLMLVESQIKSLIPEWFRSQVLGWIAPHYPNHPRMPRALRARSTLMSLSMSFAESYCGAMSITSRDVLNKIYSASFKSQIAGAESERQFSLIAQEFEHDDPMKLMQFIDFKTYLPGSVLTKVDRATMRAGVEARVPFLDNDVAKYALSLPSHMNLGWGQHKTLLRQFSSSVLDAPERGRVKKSFTSPLDSWLRTLQYPKFCRMIMSESMLDSGIFNPEAVQALMDDHYKGRANHGTTLWSLCVLSKSMSCRDALL